MWQGKSMIPKPRLSTPRRAHTSAPMPTNHLPHTPSRNPRTPSRLPRPPVRHTDAPPSTPTRNPQSTNPRLAHPVCNRGDSPAERVIATGIITDPPALSTPPPNRKSFTVTTPDAEPLVIDEQLVTRTPAKHKNTEWLASFGIDISLLRITDDDAENHHPNLTPVRDTHKSAYSNHNTPTKKAAPPAFQRRRATDFYGYAQPADTLPNPPTRIASARKSRRASARISVRELDALNFEREHQRVEPRVTKGSDVFLTPVRASRKQREKNGTPVVLSEVRRSLRINTPSKQLVPKNSVRGRIELLEANDHSYIPNPCLSDRSFSG